MHEKEILVGQLLGLFLAGTAKGDLVSQKTKMRVVAQETQHDQVSIESIQTVPHVWIVVWLCLGQADVVGDLMLAFSRDLMARQDDLDALPVDIFGHLLVDKVLELLRQLGHELRA